MSRVKLRRYFRHGLFPQLIVFEAVARLGSMTRAAAELHLAQPTVSMQLKKLSGALDLTLFEPDGRGVRLTPAGAALQAACAEVVQMFARIDERLEPFRGKAADTLRFAAEPEARPVAARLVADFCARHPGMQASVHIADRTALLQRLAADTDDVYVFKGRERA